MAIPAVGRATLAAADASSGDNGTFQGGQVYFVGGVSMASGAGAPGDNFNAGLPVVGDIWIRIDGGVGTTLYRCTGAGPGSIWAAIL